MEDRARRARRARRKGCGAENAEQDVGIRRKRSRVYYLLPDLRPTGRGVEDLHRVGATLLGLERP